MIFLVIFALLVLGGMAFAFGIARMADKPAPKPPLRLVDHPVTVPETVLEMRGPYESSTVHGRRVPPTTDDRGLQ